MTKKTIIIPKDFPHWVKPRRDPDTPGHARLRLVIVLLAVPLYFLAYILSFGMGYGLTGSMLGFSFFFLLAMINQIRPGTSFFWKAFLALILILYAPMAAVTPLIAWSIIAVYLLFLGFTGRRLYPILREETWGWRLIVFSGLALSSFILIGGCLGRATGL